MAEYQPRRFDRRRALGLGVSAVAAAGAAVVLGPQLFNGQTPDQATPGSAPPRGPAAPPSATGFFRAAPPAFMTQLHGLHEPYWSEQRYADGPNAGRRMPDQMLTAHLDSLVTLGVQGVRTDMGWSAVQPNPGDVDWETGHGYRFMELQRLLAERNLKMLLTVTRSPEWARPGTGDDPAQFPTDLQAASEFPRELAPALQPELVVGVECWNEPNIGAFTGIDDDAENARRYVPVLNAFYAGIQAGRAESGNSPVPVVFGGPSRNDAAFVEACLRQGPQFDVFAVNPYMADQGRDVRTPPDPSRPTDHFTTSYPQLQELLRRYGYADVPQIWAEIGFSVDANAVGTPQHRGVPTAADAARQLTVAYDLSAEYGVGSFGVYAAYATNDRSAGMSLLRRDGTPYEHATALAEHVRQRRAAPVSSQPVRPRSFTADPTRPPTVSGPHSGAVSPTTTRSAPGR